MIYFDTSFLAPLFKREATSAAVEKFTDGLPSRVATLSGWTRVEFSSLLAKEVQIGSLSSAEAHMVEGRFDSAIRTGFTIIGVTPADFDLAKTRLSDRRSGLRAGDALHLAIAANNRVQSICSFDKVLVRNARAVGLPIVSP